MVYAFKPGQVIIRTQLMFVELNLQFNKSFEKLVLLLNTKGTRGLIMLKIAKTLLVISSCTPTNPMKKNPNMMFFQTKSFHK